MVTRPYRMVTYLYRVLSIKPHHPLIMWSCEITWQIESHISPLPQYPWPPNLAGWLDIMRNFFHRITWPFDPHVDLVILIFLTWFVGLERKRPSRHQLLVFIVWTSHPQNFLNLLLFLINFRLFELTMFVLKKEYNFLGSCSGTRLFISNSSCWGLKFKNAPKETTAKYCSGSDCP